jgi:hypothetical protein
MIRVLCLQAGFHVYVHVCVPVFVKSPHALAFGSDFKRRQRSGFETPRLPRNESLIPPSLPLFSIIISSSSIINNNNNNNNNNYSN